MLAVIDFFRNFVVQMSYYLQNWAQSFSHFLFMNFSSRYQII